MYAEARRARLCSNNYFSDRDICVRYSAPRRPQNVVENGGIARVYFSRLNAIIDFRNYVVSITKFGKRSRYLFFVPLSHLIIDMLARLPLSLHSYICRAVCLSVCLSPSSPFLTFHSCRARLPRHIRPITGTSEKYAFSISNLELALDVIHTRTPTVWKYVYVHGLKTVSTMVDKGGY